MDQHDYLDDVAPAPEDSPFPAADAAPPPPVTDPDGDVLILVARGDADGALRRLMKRHGPAVYRFCREALHDAVLADDVQQQIFIEVHRDLASFQRRSTVRTWIFGIARHRVLDAAKCRRRARARIGDADPTEIPDVCPAPSVALDDAQLHDALIACVRELDDDVRTALLLRYQQGFTYEEMAAVCGEKAGTLHARVARALPTLRTRIEHRLRRTVPARRR